MHLVRLLTFFVILFNTSNVFCQTIFGKVIDKNTKLPVGFATVGILGSNQGTLTDLDGVYILNNVQPGTVELQYSYLGYISVSKSISISNKESIEVNVEMEEDAVNLGEVVVKAQAMGQKAAINRQINSNTIVNVVSREKLQELPDQNAAEAVGRLSGVSVVRDAGEGQRISIRGVSPRLNNVTIDGQRMASTQGNDRSTDLSMISPDMLDGIELFKALTPDKDGDAIGGSVNFTIAKPQEGLKAGFKLLGTYNRYAKDAQNMQSNFNISNRLANNKFGFLVTANYQTINRSFEGLDSDYEYVGVNQQNAAIINVAQLNLTDNRERRQRYGGSLTMDYSPNEFHSIVFNSSLGYTNRDELRFRKRYSFATAEQRLDNRKQETQINIQSYSLKGKHQFGKLELDWSGSINNSINSNPESLAGVFFENGATTGLPSNPSDINTIPIVFKNDLINTTFRDISYTNSETKEYNKSAQINFKYNVKLSSQITGYLKTGFKWRNTTRERDDNSLFLRPYLVNENVARNNPGLFITNTNGQISLVNFIGDYNAIDFFNGSFDIQPGDSDKRAGTTVGFDKVDINKFNELFGTSYSPSDKLGYNGHIDYTKLQRFYDRFKSSFLVNIERDFEDYDGQEDIYAGYLMADFQLGRYFSSVIGARIEDTRQKYTSRSGTPVEDGDPNTGFTPEIIKSAGQYSRSLPMFHLKYKPKKWMDLRFAATKSLARPDFFNLVPWERINNSNRTINRGKPDLLNTDAWNYDVFASFYNKNGLLTIGAFYKQMRNIDYISTRAINDINSTYNSFLVKEPANSPTSYVKGVELDLQASLSSLTNSFLSGIVYGFNATILSAQTFYPILIVERISNPTPPPFFITKVIDSLRTGPIVGQPGIILNTYIGYETKRFSGRLSFLYQGKALSVQGGVGVREELDSYDSGFARMDLALKYKLNKKGNYTLVCNVNNLLDTPEISYLGRTTNNLITRQRFFGTTTDVGFFIKF